MTNSRSCILRAWHRERVEMEGIASRRRDEVDGQATKLSIEVASRTISS